MCAKNLVEVFFLEFHKHKKCDHIIQYFKYGLG